MKEDTTKHTKGRKKKKTVKDRLLDVLLIFFILVFVGCGGYLGYYYYMIHKGQARAEELSEMIPEDDEYVDEEFGHHYMPHKRGKLLDLDKESLFELLKKAIIPKEDTY